MRKRIFAVGKVSVVVLGAFALVATIVYATTTVGTNINTDGNLIVSGNATTTGRLVIGSTDPTNDLGAIWIGGGVYASGVATSATAFWVGSAGTVNNLSMTGGDLYVQDDVEIDGSLWAENATTTDSLKVGGYASSTGGLFTQGAAHIGGAFSADGTTNLRSSITDVTTSTATSTAGLSGLFVQIHTTATSSVSVGKQGSAIGGCLELVRQSSDTYFHCYIGDDNAFTCAAGRCN